MISRRPRAGRSSSSRKLRNSTATVPQFRESAARLISVAPGAITVPIALSHLPAKDRAPLAAELTRIRGLAEELAALDSPCLSFPADSSGRVPADSARPDQFAPRLGTLRPHGQSGITRVSTLAPNPRVSHVFIIDRTVLALQVDQRLLDLTGQNIANASTPGYHNQVANLAEIVTTGSAVGAGVSIDRHHPRSQSGPATSGEQQHLGFQHHLHAARRPQSGAILSRDRHRHVARLAGQSSQRPGIAHHPAERSDPAPASPVRRQRM